MSNIFTINLNRSRVLYFLFSPPAVFFVLIAGLYCIYRQAQGLTWQFDDYINLKGLADASSPAGVLNFVFSGVAGPLGRPLSLATFLVNYKDWPGNPWGFVQVSLLMHAINGSLVFLLSRRVLIHQQLWGANCRHAEWLALSIALLWLCLPIHASGLLMPVQRMTHISSFFILVSLYGYILLRQHQGGRVPTWAGMLLLSVWVVATGLAAVYSKENGLVVISFVFLLELYCFYPIWRHDLLLMGKRFWYAWLVLAGGAVGIILLLHVSTRWSALRQSFELYRGYHWSEHIATQSIISFEYLRQIVLPRSALLGPFQDNHIVHGWNESAPYLVILFWAVFLVGGLWFARNFKISPMARALGWVVVGSIFWFFAAHQIESTIIPLELYFEHRNYLASLGFCLLIVLLFDYSLRIAKQRWMVFLIGFLYAAYLIFSLQQAVSLWGQPLLAHDLWQKNHPRSTRAVQTVLQDLIQLGYQDAAISLSNDFVDSYNSLDVAIVMMPMHCKHSNISEQQKQFEKMLRLIVEMRSPGGIPTGLAALGNSVRDGKCLGISEASYEGFLRQLLLRPQIEYAVKVRHHIYYELALMSKKRQDVAKYAEYMQKAFWDYPTISLAQAVAAVLFQEQRIDEAIEWIDEVIEYAPNRYLRISWRTTLQSMRDALVHVRGSLLELDHN